MSAGARLPGTPEPMHFWTGFGGVRLAGDSWGDPNGPLVLLLHGGGQTRRAWKKTGEILGAAGYFVVAYDARGHGDSDWAVDKDYGLETMVQDLQCLVADLGNRRPALVGASMGGGTSLLAVGEGYIDASALILVDTAPNIEEAGVRNIHAFMGQKPGGFCSLEEAAEAAGQYQPHRKHPVSVGGLAKNLRLGADGRYRWHWDPAYLARNIDLTLRQKRLEACALRLRLPTLLVRGALSDLLSERGARAFLRNCPHSEFFDVAEAAHMVVGDRNDVFGSAVVDFLSRVIPIAG